jgi:aminoglycoside 3-N-acetyltransferase
MNTQNSVTKKEITDVLRDSGVKNGDILLIHSSLSRFGHVEGGVDAVIDGLLDAVGKDGTILVPTLTGSASLSATNPPVFDVRNTPCWTGIIPETFRKRPEAIRSLHPTHSVAAIGKRARELTANHENCVTPCGEGSPYIRLARAGGYVLMLGVTLESCTLLHGVEEIANVPYHMQKEWVKARVTDENGETRTHRIKIHLYGYARNFIKLEPDLLRENIMKKSWIGGAEVRLIDAHRLMDTALEQVRKDPKYLFAEG